MRNAFAACVYRSAAFSHFSCLPPNRLNPPPAPEAALSACEDVRAYRDRNGGVALWRRTFCSSALGSCAMIVGSYDYLE